MLHILWSIILGPCIFHGVLLQELLLKIPQLWHRHMSTYAQTQVRVTSQGIGTCSSVHNKSRVNLAHGPRTAGSTGHSMPLRPTVLIGQSLGVQSKTKVMETVMQG